MAKQLKEVKGFGKGIANSVSPEDMPDNASPSSKNVHPHSAHGILKGIPEDKILIAGANFAKGTVSYQPLGGATVTGAFLPDEMSMDMTYQGDDHMITDAVEFALMDATDDPVVVLLPIGDGVSDNTISVTAIASTMSANSNQANYNLGEALDWGVKKFRIIAGLFNKETDITDCNIRNWPKIYYEVPTDLAMVIDITTTASRTFKLWTSDNYGDDTRARIRVVRLEANLSEPATMTEGTNVHSEGFQYLRETHTAASPQTFTASQIPGLLEFQGLVGSTTQTYRVYLDIEVNSLMDGTPINDPDLNLIDGFETADLASLPEFSHIRSEKMADFLVNTQSEIVFNFNRHAGLFQNELSWTNYANSDDIQAPGLALGIEQTFKTIDSNNPNDGWLVNFKNFFETQNLGRWRAVYEAQTAWDGDIEWYDYPIKAFNSDTNHSLYSNGKIARLDVWMWFTKSTCMPIYSEKFKLGDGRDKTFEGVSSPQPWVGTGSVNPPAAYDGNFSGRKIAAGITADTYSWAWLKSCIADISTTEFEELDFSTVKLKGVGIHNPWQQGGIQTGGGTWTYYFNGGEPFEQNEYENGMPVMGQGYNYLPGNQTILTQNQINYPSQKGMHIYNSANHTGEIWEDCIEHTPWNPAEFWPIDWLGGDPSPALGDWHDSLTNQYHAVLRSYYGPDKLFHTPMFQMFKKTSIAWYGDTNDAGTYVNNDGDYTWAYTQHTQVRTLTPPSFFLDIGTNDWQFFNNVFIDAATFENDVNRPLSDITTGGTKIYFGDALNVQEITVDGAVVIADFLLKFNLDVYYTGSNNSNALIKSSTGIAASDITSITATAQTAVSPLTYYSVIFSSLPSPASGSMNGRGVAIGVSRAGTGGEFRMNNTSLYNEVGLSQMIQTVGVI